MKRVQGDMERHCDRGVAERQRARNKDSQRDEDTIRQRRRGGAKERQGSQRDKETETRPSDDGEKGKGETKKILRRDRGETEERQRRDRGET